jgi:hypothetical protein
MTEIIYESPKEKESWKKTLEEIEDDDIEWKMDKQIVLDKIYTKLKLKQLKIELDRFKNCPKT